MVHFEGTAENVQFNRYLLKIEFHFLNKTHRKIHLQIRLVYPQNTHISQKYSPLVPELYCRLETF